MKLLITENTSKADYIVAELARTEYAIHFYPEVSPFTAGKFYLFFFIFLLQIFR